MRRRLLLSLVLVLQVLPGHFQLAFQTQVVLGLMVLWSIAEHWGHDLGARRRGEVGGAGPALRKGGAVVLAVAAIYPLAAIQLWPTARLAELAGARSDFEYLSGFADHTVPSGQFRGSGTVPSLAHLEAAGLGPVPRHARGDA